MSNKFINPYTFIDLEENGCTRHSQTEYESANTDHLTGVMHCSLITKGQVIIPDVKENNSSDQADQAVPYFHLKEKDGKPLNPVIPGSELRGVIRSRYEELSNSCLSTTDPQKSFDGRVQEWAVNCGVYDTRKNVLYDAGKQKQFKLQRSLLNPNSDGGDIIDNGCIHINNEEYCYGDEVWFETEKSKVSRISKDQKSGLRKHGYLMIGEIHPSSKNGLKERKVSVIEASDHIVSASNVDDILPMLKAEKAHYQNDKINQQKKKKEHTGYSYVDLDRHFIPLYYRKSNDIIYVSLASKGRIIYNHKLGDYLDTYSPCDQPDEYCPACHLFGSVNDDLIRSSKIRITDAVMNSEDTYIDDQNEVALILSSPKYQNSSFYLHLMKAKAVNARNNISVFNVDYLLKGNNEKDKVPLDVSDVNIRGRKEYWHFKPNTAKQRELIDKVENQDVVSRFKPIKKDTKFFFDVYFDDISKNELEQLITTISLEGNSELGYKIGSGKPYGYGSVQMSVDSYQIREKFDPQKLEYNVSKEYQLHKDFEPKSFEECFETEFFGREKDDCERTFNEIRLVTHLSYLEENYPNIDVIYPEPLDPEGMSYEWFMNNQVSNRYKQILPFVQDELNLPDNKPLALEKNKKENNETKDYF